MVTANIMLLQVLMFLLPIASGIFFPRFKFFDPFRPQSPKVYYYSVQSNQSPVIKEHPRDKCRDVGGFYVNGMCYIHFANNNNGGLSNHAEAQDDCENYDIIPGIKCRLWVPNLNDLDLYRKIAESKPGNFFKSDPATCVWMNLKECKNLPDYDFSDNHLCQVADESAGNDFATLLDDTEIDSSCSALCWDYGAFFVENRDCDGSLPHVCKCWLSN